MFIERSRRKVPNSLPLVSRSPILVILSILVAVAPGCATARLNQFENFAQAGTAYVKASQIVLDAAGVAAIDADSLIVQKGRPALATQDERRKYIGTSDEELQKRLLLLRQIGRHGALLQQYFEALGTLADPKTASGVGDAAQGVFDSLGKLSLGIKNATIAGTKIEDQIPKAANFVVQRFKVKALESELNARAKDIERELALQEAALKVIGDTMATDLTVQLQLEEGRDVIEPYAASHALPEAWVADRQKILEASVAAQSIQDAANAAAKLRASFVALVAGQSPTPSIASLIAAINSTLDAVGKTSSTTPGK